MKKPMLEIELKDYLDEWFVKIEKRLDELSDILLGNNGEDGITHRVRTLEAVVEKEKSKNDKRFRQNIILMVTVATAGSAIWIKESRDFIISLVLSLFGL